MRLLVLLLLLPVLPARAQLTEFRVTVALDSLAALAHAEDTAALKAWLACPDGEAVRPCDTLADATAKAFAAALRDALPADAAWLPDAIAARTVEGYALTEVQLKVRRDGALVGQPVVLLADHPARPLLVRVGDGPPLLLGGTPSLAGQLAAQTEQLRQAAAGMLPAERVRALVACRMATTEGFAPVPCTTPRAEGDPAARVQQVLQEVAFVLPPEAGPLPVADAVVVPQQLEGFDGVQVQMPLTVDGERRHPTLFYIAHGDAHLFVSAHPDMAPLAPPIPGARARLEALVGDLLAWAAAGDTEAAAAHLVYRGDGAERWLRALDPGVPADLDAAREALQAIRRHAGAYDRYEVVGLSTDAEAEGVWHVLRVDFARGAETETVRFAFLPLGDAFVLGDLD